MVGENWPPLISARHGAKRAERHTRGEISGGHGWQCQSLQWSRAHWKPLEQGLLCGGAYQAVLPEPRITESSKFAAEALRSTQSQQAFRIQAHAQRAY